MNLDGGENELFIRYKKLLEDDQEIVEEVQEIKQKILENKLFNIFHNWKICQKESEEEQEDEVKVIQQITIEFIRHKEGE